MRGDTIVEQRTRPGRSSTETSTSRQSSVRCGVPYSRLRAATVRRDGRRRRKGGPRVPRDGQACRRGHVVRRHVVRGAQSARRHRVVAENGASQPLTLDHSFVQKTLYDQPPASQGPLEVSDVTRSSVKLSWLAPTSNGGAEIVAYVFERPERLSPTWTYVARVRTKTSRSIRLTAIRSFPRPTSRSADS